MALYSTSVETQIVDPVFSSKNRCEFRIPDREGSYLPNLRLGNVGVTTNATPVVAVPYALGCGVASVIKRIQLMDGNEELDSLREANSWLTFKSFFRPNAEASGIKMIEEGGAGRGFTSGNTLEVDVPLPSQKFANDVGEVSLEIFTGYIDLRVIFPLLNQLTHLNTKMFPNLRVVMEWETDESRILVSTGHKPVPTTPILMADVIMDEALIATLDSAMLGKAITFDAIEVDRIGLPAVAAALPGDGTSLEQVVTLQSKGFLGKYVKRICVQKSAQDATGYVDADALVRGFGANGSLSMEGERSNLRINGRNLLGGNGFVTAAQTMMGVTDTWGEINSYPYSAMQSVGLDSREPTSAALNGPAGLPPTVPSLLIKTQVATAQQSQLIGQQAYLGYRLDERCDNLQLQYRRLGRKQASGGPGTGAALNLTLFAEVSKKLVVRGMGDWAVSYV